MKDQLPIFEATTSEDTLNAISSPESESGPTLSGSPGGQTVAKYGPEVVPANPSARPAKVKRSTMKGTFGQTSFVSSKHEDLSYALASRLRPLTDSLGSTLFNLTWMTRATPAGRSISALRASEPLTEGSVFIGWPTPRAEERQQKNSRDDYMALSLCGKLAAWPTPTTEDHKSDGPKSAARVDSGEWRTCDQRLRNLVLLAGWPTTRATDAEKNIRTVEGAQREMKRKGSPQDLMQAALLTAWGTPAARDWKSGDASQDTLDKNARPLNEQVRLAGWKTPCVPNGGRISGNETDIGKHRDGTKAQISLENEAKLSGWTTPTSTERSGQGPTNKSLALDAKLSGWATPKVASGDYQTSGMDKILNLQGQARLTAFGETPIGYLLGPNGWEIVPASGQLNASHSRWLMGLPPAWDDCGVTAMESLRRRRKRL